MSWEDNIRRVTPYTPGEQPKDRDIIKLNTNENPYPPSEAVMKALSGDAGAGIAAVSPDALRRYPDPAASALVHAIAENIGVGDENVFVGVGSDDVLSMCFLTLFNSDKPVLFPDITYSFYDVWTDVYRIPYETVALDSDFRIKADDYKKPNGGIIFPNPNAPTGVEEPQELIRKILEENPDSVVIVDEAYVDFGACSAVPLLKEYDNLLVVQTFSKSRSMAGMRIGYAIGSAQMIKYLNDVKYSVNSYTMSAAAIAAGVASVKDTNAFEDSRKKIIATRERVKPLLKELGFSFPDSKANFIFATHEKVPARELFEALREAKIFVRYFDKPRIDNYLRITIGTDDEMDALIEFLRKR